METVEVCSDRVDIRVRYSYTQNEDDRSSTITVHMDARTGGTSGHWRYSLEVGDNWVGDMDVGDYKTISGWTEMCSDTETIYHDSSGRASVYINCIVVAPTGTSLNGQSFSGGTTVDFPIIEGAAAISKTLDITLGERCGVTWKSGTDSQCFKLKFYTGAWEKEVSVAPGKAGYCTYDGLVIPKEVANQFVNQKTDIMSVELKTFANNSYSPQIGASSISTFTISISNDMKPTISNLKFTIDNSSNEAASKWNTAIAGYSRVRITATGNGSYGSKVKQFQITGGYNATELSNQLDETTDIIVNSGTKKFNVVCTDSRNVDSEIAVSDPIIFHKYRKPIIQYFAANRTQADPTKVYVNAKWENTVIDGHNTSYCTLYYKRMADDIWTTVGTIQNGVDTPVAGVFDVKTGYNFRIIVKDDIGNSAERYSFASTEGVLLDFKAGGKGFGIGKLCDTDAMEVFLPAKFMSDVFIGAEKIEAFIKRNVDEYLNTIT